MSAVRAAVIPCAGRGERLLPLTLATPKELLPLGPYPALCATLAEAAACLEEVVVVVSPDKPALARLLDPGRWPRGGPGASSPRRSGEPSAAPLQALRDLLARLRVTLVEQPAPLGALDAIARGVARCGEPCAVLYPDLVRLAPVGEGDDGAGEGAAGAGLRALLDAHARCGAPVFGCYEAQGPALDAPRGPSAQLLVDEAPPPGPAPVRRALSPAGPPAPGELRSTFAYVHDGAFSAALEAAARPAPGAALGDDGLLPALGLLAAEGRLFAQRLPGLVLDLGTMAGYLDAAARVAAGRARLPGLP